MDRTLKTNLKMKQLFVWGLMVCGLHGLQGQEGPGSANFGFAIDHYSLVVNDLSETGDFYREVVGLQEIPHPDRDPRFRWFRLASGSQLHLIEKSLDRTPRDKSTHLCLTTPDLDGFMAHLKAKGIDHYDWPGRKNKVTLRSDGVNQIYIQDPEGHWIEINDRKI